MFLPDKLIIHNSVSIFMSEGELNTDIPKCIFCGKADEVYRTGKYGTFYCKHCDTIFEPITLPNCPKCRKNDDVITNHSGRVPYFQPSMGGQFQYWCNSCKYFFSDETLLYNELGDMGVEYNDEEGGRGYSEGIEDYGDYPGDDNSMPEVAPS
ncbi:hypothetical protein Thermo_01648 [Thermoplasmatales archaeon]|nr:hypothetical protein Thermo_01648 [Thermoplasmatales archaeon]